MELTKQSPRNDYCRAVAFADDLFLNGEKGHEGQELENKQCYLRAVFTVVLLNYFILKKLTTIQQNKCIQLLLTESDGGISNRMVRISNMDIVQRDIMHKI